MKTTIIILFWFCLSGTVMGENYIEGLVLEIHMSTSSDWTQIEFVNVAVGLIDEKIITETPHLWVSGFHITKQPYDSTRVEVHYEVLVKDLPAKEEVLFYIEKGDIGVTEVTFLSGNQVIGRFINDLNVEGDPTNKKAFSVQREVFNSCKLTRRDVSCRRVPKLVLAFYYPWYGNPEGPHKNWSHWDPGRGYSSVHIPILGYYDSADTMIIRKHIDFAQKSGIDGFIISWWGKWTSSDTVTTRIFEIAEKTNFKATIYYENAERVEDVVSDVEYILRRYGKSVSFLKIQEKPVIFYYSRAVSKFSAEEWEEIFSRLKSDNLYSCNIAEATGLEIASVFDGIHVYNNMGIELLTLFNRGLAATALIHRKIFGATVVPGYNDTLVNKFGRVIERSDGKYYSRAWEAALNSNPDIILITSFNEWNEGTEIEPSKEYDMIYLDITRKYAPFFKTYEK